MNKACSQVHPDRVQEQSPKLAIPTSRMGELDNIGHEATQQVGLLDFFSIRQLTQWMQCPQRSVPAHDTSERGTLSRPARQLVPASLEALTAAQQTQSYS